MGCWLAAGQGAGREEPSASAGPVAWAAHSRYQKTVTKGGFPELIRPTNCIRDIFGHLGVSEGLISSGNESHLL